MAPWTRLDAALGGKDGSGSGTNTNLAFDSSNTSCDIACLFYSSVDEQLDNYQKAGLLCRLLGTEIGISQDGDRNISKYLLVTYFHSPSIMCILLTCFKNQIAVPLMA
jgi:hypothetical protein